MATVRSYTSQRMKEIEDSTVVGGLINALGRLILKTRAGADIDAGSVVGPQGPVGLGPTGAIILFAGDTAPEGHLICDGSAKSRTAYPQLFAAIGTKYGAGDGSTTFNLPNFKGRVPVGRDPADTQFDALGEMGGAKTHTLSVDEMPNHTHTQNAHTHIQNAHNHSLGPGQSFGMSFGPNAGAVATFSVNVSTANAQTYQGPYVIGSTTAVNNNTTATNNNTGGGLAHNNLQPYIVMNYIIKT